MVWCPVVWCGVLWCSVVWCAVVCGDQVLRSPLHCGPIITQPCLWFIPVLDFFHVTGSLVHTDRHMCQIRIQNRIRTQNRSFLPAFGQRGVMIAPQTSSPMHESTRTLVQGCALFFFRIAKSLRTAPHRRLSANRRRLTANRWPLPAEFRRETTDHRWLTAVGDQPTLACYICYCSAMREVCVSPV